MATLKDRYVDTLKQRAKESRVYRKYQLVGLEIAGILKDEKHKALYIKLAKDMKGDELLRLAKDVAERRQIKNRGAYFMRLVTMNRARLEERPNPAV